MGSGLNKFKRCSEKSDIFKGNYICYTGLLKLIVYSRAVCTTKISNTKGRAPFECTNSLRSCFASFITHHGTFCSFICLSASSYRKSRKNKRNENVSCRCIISCFLAMQSPLSFANTFRMAMFLSPRKFALLLFSFLFLLFRNACLLVVPIVSPRARLALQVLMMSTYGPQKHLLCQFHGKLINTQ